MWTTRWSISCATCLLLAVVRLAAACTTRRDEPSPGDATAQTTRRDEPSPADRRETEPTPPGALWSVSMSSPAGPLGVVGDEFVAMVVDSRGPAVPPDVASSRNPRGFRAHLEIRRLSDGSLVRRLEEGCDGRVVNHGSGAFVVRCNGRVHLVDAATGGVRWRSAVAAEPVEGVGGGSEVYVADNRTVPLPARQIGGTVQQRFAEAPSTLYSLSADTGEVVWSVPIPTNAKAILTGEQFVVVVLSNGYAVVSKRQRSIAWTREDPSHGRPPAHLEGDAVIIMASRHGAAEQGIARVGLGDGRERWRVPGAFGNLDVLRDGVLFTREYVASGRHHAEYLVAIETRTGRTRWRTELPKGVSHDLLADETSIYFANDKSLFCLIAETGQLRWEHSLPFGGVGMGWPRIMMSRRGILFSRAQRFCLLRVP